MKPPPTAPADARSTVFLTAEWRRLVLLNYVVDPALLRPFVPVGTELDFFHDQTYVSLVGFRFLNTRILGVPIPFHRDFDELNLRFYVRRQSPDGWRAALFSSANSFPAWPSP